MTRRHPSAEALAGVAPDPGTGGPDRPRWSGRLSSEQQAEFARHGYLVVADVLPVPELAALDAEFEAAYRERIADPAIAADDQRRNQIHRLGTDSESSRRLACDPRILGLVEDLVYPGLALFSAKLISKGPHEPHNVCHWHQDEAYWNIYGASDRRMSIWLPLQDTHRRNGCLRVVPGSHRRRIVPHQPRSSRDHGACRLSFLPGERELRNTVYCEIPAGSAVLFSNKIFHSSLGNHTGRHRRAFILTYMEAAAGAGKDSDFTILRPAAA
ncbi:MAG: phytanoyl-CoA dioxygenase family protein [Spirochaetaceae bacterium]|nr:phytanoyl-CoA dioxygenase family protein [Spirochaetaceae bacterium]